MNRNNEERPVDFLAPLAWYAALFAGGFAMVFTLCKFW